MQQVQQTLRRLRNKLPLRFSFHYLRTSWLEWLAVGFMLDVHAKHFGVRVGKLLFEVDGLATGGVFNGVPLPFIIEEMPHMPPNAMAVVPTRQRLGHYNLRTGEVVIDHPRSIIAVSLTDERKPKQ